MTLEDAVREKIRTYRLMDQCGLPASNASTVKILEEIAEGVRRKGKSDWAMRVHFLTIGYVIGAVVQLVISLLTH